MTNAITAIKQIHEPPTVVISRLPSHQLITLKTYEGTGEDGHVVTIYEDPSRYTQPLELHAYKIGLREANQQRPYMTPPMLEFSRTHCRSCPHNDPMQTGAEPCRMRLGEWHQAFHAVQRLVPADDIDPFNVTTYTENGEPIGAAVRRTVTQNTCLAGHPDPSPPNPEDWPRNPPLVWVPPQPVVLTMRIHMEEPWKFDTANFSVGHLVKIDGKYHVGPRHLHLNTFSYGRVCWGQGNNAPPLTSFFDSFHAAIFNLDLTNDFEEWLKECERYHQLVKGLPQTRDSFRPIDEASIISTDNEVKALMSLPKSWRELTGHVDAGTCLAASGVPMNSAVNPMLPLKPHVIAAGDAQINGWITPIIPAIGKCWFVQPNDGNGSFGRLLGQIDPPQDA